MGWVNLIFFFFSFLFLEKNSFCFKPIHLKTFAMILTFKNCGYAKSQESEDRNTAETVFQSLCENICKFLHAKLKKKKDFAINWREKLFLILPRAVSVVVWCMFWINLTNFSMLLFASFKRVYLKRRNEGKRTKILGKFQTHFGTDFLV